MGRCLEFALATFVIVVINTIYALWTGSLIADRVGQLLNQAVQALSIIN